MKEKISFIVPVYNVERYVERCIRSIMAQNYDNIEIIIIDDGSPDNSPAIVDRLAGEDRRIKVIHQRNAGVSAARNRGLDEAAGEYIIFVDSDDYIERGYASYFYHVIKSTSADMVFSRKCIFDDGTEYSSSLVEILSGEEACRQLYLNKVGVGVCNKIYKRPFLEQNRIRFNTEFWFAEGMTFNIECFSLCSKIAAVNRPFYHITTNAESATRKFDLKSWLCGRKAMRYQKNMIKNMNKGVKNAWNYHYRQYYFSILCGIYKSGSEDKYRKVIKQCTRGLRKNITYPLKVDIPKRQKLKSLCTAISPHYMAKREAENQKAYENSIIAKGC